MGVAVLVLAALALVNGNGFDPTKDEYTMLFKTCATVIAMGSLLTIVGFIGCCGAAFENQCLLGTVQKHTNITVNFILKSIKIYLAFISSSS